MISINTQNITGNADKDCRKFIETYFSDPTIFDVLEHDDKLETILSACISTLFAFFAITVEDEFKDREIEQLVENFETRTKKKLPREREAIEKRCIELIRGCEMRYGQALVTHECIKYIYKESMKDLVRLCIASKMEKLFGVKHGV